MKIFVWNCLKSQRKKKFFFSHFFTFEVPFNSLFGPTSLSRMSNIFRDSESLEKSNGKKWSNIWTFLFGRGLELARNKKVFFVAYFALVHPPMASVLLSASVERSFVSHMRDLKKIYIFFFAIKKIDMAQMSGDTWQVTCDHWRLFDFLPGSCHPFGSAGTFNQLVGFCSWYRFLSSIMTCALVVLTYPSSGLILL